MDVREKGFSLVEVIVALTLLGFLAAAILTGAAFMRKSAESTVYSSIADSVAIGFLEQLKGEEYGTLRYAAINNGNFQFIILNQEELFVPLNGSGFTPIKIPVHTQRSGSKSTEMQYSIRVRVTPSANLPLMNIHIEYRWADPMTGKEYSAELAGARSSVTR
jgi:prepilin-type N-terminal cleavage/methylation domain-containing protein